METDVKSSKKTQALTVSKPMENKREFLLDPGAEVKNLSKMYGGGLIALIIGVVSALVLGYVFIDTPHAVEISTLILLGMIFLALYIYVVWLYRDTTIDIREEKINFGRSFLGYMNAFIILGVTLLMLQMGLNIPWFRYYIVEQSGQDPLVLFNLIVIPYSYLKVASAALSSLVAFSLTCYLDIRRNIKDIEVYRKRNANVSTIIYTKEEFIKNTNGRINIKVLIFLVLLGFALIPYSEDGFANIVLIGLLLIVPCVVVFLIFFMVGFIGKYDEISKPFLLETVKVCHKCQTENINTAVFCRNCKEKIQTDQVLFGKTVECKFCTSINPSGSKFCMNCGEIFDPFS